MRDLSPQERETIDRHFGTPDALDEAADAILVEMILDLIHRLPSINRRDEIALAAIASLGEDKPDLAREMLREYREASGL